MEAEPMEHPERIINGEDTVAICYGSVAWWLGKKTEEYYTHRWTVYVRGANNEDLRHVVSKVTFTLHQSFKNPVREVTEPPYEVTEAGWGEFDVGVSIELVPAAASKPVDLTHGLKLHLDAGSGQPSTKKPVISEHYEEIVFNSPTVALHNILANHVPRRAPPSDIIAYLPKHNDREELWNILQARRIVHDHTVHMQHMLTTLGGV